MLGRETSAEINSAAIQWVVRMQRSDASVGDEAELARWLGEDSRRRGAYMRCRAAMHLVDRAGMADAPVALAAAEDSGEPWSRRRRWLIGGGLAAAAVAATLVRVGLPFGTESYLTTQLGEIKRVPLEDGSVVILNTASRLYTHFEQGQRSIGLEEGEGWFHVAKDSSRPFVVTAGFATVKAIGTAFSVRRELETIDILVSEGAVELSAKVGQISRLIVRSGESASLSAHGVLHIASVPPDVLARRLAWQSGRISVAGESLQAAAEEFNRYNRVQISVDPSLAGLSVVGVFDCNDVLAFARSAATTFDATLTQDGNFLRLSRRQPENIF